jgi:hypothetical protein
VKSQIEDGTFPRAGQIRESWRGEKAPIIVLRTKKNGERYVCDGEKRVLHACFHPERTIPALVIDVDEEREI